MLPSYGSVVSDLMAQQDPGSKSDHLMWRFGGEARTKVGLSAAALTGRSAVLRQLNARRWCMIIRDFPVNPDATYADHPYAIPRFDQAFQAVNYVDSHRW